MGAVLGEHTGTEADNQARPRYTRPHGISEESLGATYCTRSKRRQTAASRHAEAISSLRRTLFLVLLLLPLLAVGAASGWRSRLVVPSLPPLAPMAGAAAGAA